MIDTEEDWFRRTVPEFKRGGTKMQEKEEMKIKEILLVIAETNYQSHSQMNLNHALSEIKAKILKVLWLPKLAIISLQELMAKYILASPKYLK
jgi:hypothetical protein